AESRIVAAEAHRGLGQFAAAEQLLREAEGILNVRGQDAEAILDLAWARLETARGGHDASAVWFRRTFAIDEQLFREKSTPENAWALAHALELAAAALPESSASFHQRIAEIWSDEDHRFPGHAWIQHRLAEARSTVWPHSQVQ